MDEAVTQYPSAKSSSTIVVVLRRREGGDPGSLNQEAYEWTKEEAILVRDAINRELGELPCTIQEVPTMRVPTWFER